MKKIKKRVYFFIVILFIFCLFEVMLRLAGYLYLDKLYVDKSYDNRKSSHTNIVCLGESSTAGIWVPRQDSYPAQLETMLRKEYPEKDIRVFVPPHVGQNTSQVANRIENYIELYRSRIIIAMVGFNNEWSLAESHISKFVYTNDFDSARIKTLVFFSKLRLFKLMRYLYLAHVVREKSEHLDGLKATKYALGGPELMRLPQKKFVYSFADSHRESFVRLWRYDVKKIISACKKREVNIILMTYHINPTYLPVEEFVSMAHKEHIPLVRNDATFQLLKDKGILKDHLLHDNWHPNKQGYTLIAENVFQMIKNKGLLKEN